MARIRTPRSHRRGDDLRSGRTGVPANRSTNQRFRHGCASRRGGPLSGPVIVPQLCCAISVPAPPSRMASGTKRRASSAFPLPSAPSAAAPDPGAGLLIGYARVSTEDQRLDLQRDALAAAGCHRTFEDRASGARADRPGLAAALSHLPSPTCAAATPWSSGASTGWAAPPTNSSASWSASSGTASACARSRTGSTPPR